MEKYILDTNTWIEHFHRRNGVREHVSGRLLPKGFKLAHRVKLSALAKHQQCHHASQHIGDEGGCYQQQDDNQAAASFST